MHGTGKGWGVATVEKILEISLFPPRNKKPCSGGVPPPQPLLQARPFPPLPEPEPDPRQQCEVPWNMGECIYSVGNLYPNPILHSGAAAACAFFWSLSLTTWGLCRVQDVLKVAGASLELKFQRIEIPASIGSVWCLRDITLRSFVPVIGHEVNPLSNPDCRTWKSMSREVQHVTKASLRV